MKGLLRIVPPRSVVRPNGTVSHVPTMGTEVFTPDGSKVSGITKIMITADINDVWRAEISCLIEPPDVSCISDLYAETAPTRWRRLLAWIRFGKRTRPNA